MVRANHAPYMTKVLRKAIMKRSELKTKHTKVKDQETLKAYKKQRNFCSKLYKKEKKAFYNNLNLRHINDNKQFWKTVKPFLTEKGSNSSRISLIDKAKGIVSDDKEIANTFSDFFDKTNKSNSISGETSNLTDPIEKATLKFENHPSVKRIREKVNTIDNFSFKSVTILELQEEVTSLNRTKNGTFGNIPAKIVKDTSDICCPFLTDIWNKEIIEDSIFDSNLKLADETPIYKKKDRTIVDNYRPVSVLPTVSKIFERLMYKQISSFIDQYLSKYLCGYRKGYSAQTALISLVEKWKKQLDTKGYCGAILMDLSKAFDTINHDLTLAKLKAYGFDNKSLRILQSYLSDRWQRIKINTTFSSWKELTQGVPQGSVLGPLLFNIYLNDIFFFLDDIDISNYADDTTLFACNENLEEVLTRLENNSEMAIFWFEINFMKLNTDKCKLLISGFKHEQVWAQIGNDKIWEQKQVELLGITLDSALKFDEYIENICNKANTKLSILRRMSKFLDFDKKRILFKSFIESQFKYCPLVWMCHTRISNNKINKLHERALRIVYNDYHTSFEELLLKDGSMKIHISNLQLLATEMYKIFKGMSTNNIHELFISNDNRHNLRSQISFRIPEINSVWNGENSLRYLGPITWNSIPEEIRRKESLQSFKIEIKKWKPVQCPCRLCKSYVSGLGFL